MKKVLFALLAALLCVCPASAQPAFTDIAIPEGGEQAFQLSSGIGYYRLQADRDGVLRFSVGYNGTIIYSTDEAAEASTMLSAAYEADGRVFSCSVSSGHTYYFMTSVVIEPFTLKVSYAGEGQGSNPITVSSSYADGDVYTLTGSNLELTFDRRVDVAHTWLCYGDGQRAEIPADDINATLFNQYYYSINLRNAVEGLVDGGMLAEGDEFSVVLEGIADAADPSVAYGADGTFAVTLKLGSIPATLVSVSPADGSYIPNYYPEGGEGNLFTFTFSDELDPDAPVTVSVTYGDVEAGTFTSVPCKFTVSGRQVVVDLTGNNLPETVASSRGGEGATLVSFSIGGLRTADGRTVSPNYQGAGTSDILAFFTVQKQEITFYYDVEPFAGSSLAGLDNIMLWLSSPITYSGIRLDWYNARGGLQSRTFAPAEVPFEWDADEEGYVAYVPLAGISYGTSPVTLTVLDAVLANGDPAQVTVQFNTSASAVTGVEAGGGSSVSSLYGIGGTLLRQGSAATLLDGMPKGVYILDGKKVVVR